jgi:hypothetical protein
MISILPLFCHCRFLFCQFITSEFLPPDNPIFTQFDVNPSEINYSITMETVLSAIVNRLDIRKGRSHKTKDILRRRFAVLGEVGFAETDLKLAGKSNAFSFQSSLRRIEELGIGWFGPIPRGELILRTKTDNRGAT